MTTAAAAVRPRAADRRAGPWLLAGGAVTVTLLSLVLDVSTTGAHRASVAAGFGALTAATGAVVCVAAAVVLAARPGHGVGRVLAGFGLLWAADGLMESWSAYSAAHDLPGTDLAVWFVMRFGAFLLVGLPLLLVLYPTGRLVPGRWRAVSVAAAAAATVLPVLLLVAPDEVALSEVRDDTVHTDLLALPLSESVMVTLLVAGRVLALAGLVTALAVVFARHRSASGLERTQLRWLLWAGLVCLISVAVLALVPSGTVATLVLVTAVVATALSVTGGVVRPDLTDVDALVAGTLTFAGVAGVVVAVDIAALAAAGTLLGDRLDERDVSLLVLVAAVAVYGPLRGWLGGGVRRLMFGRRGDRYDVVSSFAARLESTRRVEEQLPALAGAVTETFKVPFVRVEVLTPGGGTVAATRGAPTREALEVDIAYHGERVGRLVLPRRGLRAMLSRRDHDLLVDLVRQAAVAIRNSLLAEALQESRERLVLGREEERRRIRRDLHDGLGPTLGGVALRLDAAGNAVAADPAAARDLIRLARTEVRDALEDVRRLVHDLRPPALDDLGLSAAVEQLADRLRSQVAVTVRADGLGELPAAVEVAAYRIVAEALTNVVKHAAASRAEVRLSRTPGALEVEIRDDGCGIADDVTAGVGLLSLRERAEELGGRCEVSCPDGGGTRVWAWLPAGPAEETEGR